MIRYFITFTLLASVLACTAYKPQSGGFRQGGNGNVVGNNGPSAAKGTQLRLDHTKLMASPGEYSIKINFAGASKTTSLTPSGSDSSIPLDGLPAGSQQVMVVEISQNGQAKFIAKKANVSLEQNATTTVVIDDCLVLSSPWDGKNSDGSCEWSIQESN